MPAVDDALRGLVDDYCAAFPQEANSLRQVVEQQQQRAGRRAANQQQRDVVEQEGQGAEADEFVEDTADVAPAGMLSFHTASGVAIRNAIVKYVKSEPRE